MSKLIEYKSLEPKFNVQAAVKNLRTAYWSNEPEKVAKAFKEAEDIIISAIVHHGYTVALEDETVEWISVSEGLPEEKINPNTQDFEEVLCTTIWGDVRIYKFGKPKGHDKAHFWSYGEIMDEFIVKWSSLPKASESEKQE